MIFVLLLILAAYSFPIFFERYEEELDIGHSTMSTYMARIHRKLGTKAVGDLIRLAAQEGILTGSKKKLTENTTPVKSIIAPVSLDCLSPLLLLLLRLGMPSVVVGSIAIARRFEIEPIDLLLLATLKFGATCWKAATLPAVARNPISDNFIFVKIIV